MLDYLDEHRYRWGIVTNKYTEFTIPLLEKLELLSRLHCLVCGDSLAYAKPHPAPLLHASEKLATPPENCVYIGDTSLDIDAAHAAGMPILLAHYGYAVTPSVEHQSKVAKILQRPWEIIEWLR